MKPWIILNGCGRADNMIGLLTDTTKCTGCEKCVKACRKENKCRPEQPEHKSRPEELFDTRWTAVIRKPGPRFIRRQCRHCLEPSCVSVCPVGAMTKMPEGPVVYDKKKCIGCRYCMIACPYGIPRYEWHSRAPAVAKCTLCRHRLAKGKQPACTEACPEEATIFGEREELLAVAAARISGNTDLYVPKIYGEKEVGGASVLYLSDIPLDFLGMKNNMGDKPLNRLSLRAIGITPLIAGSVVLSMSGIRWLMNRRLLIQKAGKTGKNS